MQKFIEKLKDISKAFPDHKVRRFRNASCEDIKLLKESGIKGIWKGRKRKSEADEVKEDGREIFTDI